MVRFILPFLLVIMMASHAQASFWDNEEEYSNYEYVDESTTLTWELSTAYPVYGSVANLRVTSKIFLDDPYPRIEITVARTWIPDGGDPVEGEDWNQVIDIGDPADLPVGPFYIQYSQIIKTWESESVAEWGYNFSFTIVEGTIPSIATPEVLPLLGMGLGLLFIWGVDRQRYQWM